MDSITHAALKLRSAESIAATTADAERGHKAADAWARLVNLCEHQRPGWGEIAAELLADGDDQAAAAVLTAGARA